MLSFSATYTPREDWSCLSSASSYRAIKLYRQLCPQKPSALVEWIFLSAPRSRYLWINPSISHSQFQTLRAQEDSSTLFVCVLFFFTNRVINNWNSLPPNTVLVLVLAGTLNSFKNVDKHWEQEQKIYSTRKLTKTSLVNTRCTPKKNNVDYNIHQNTTQQVKG